MPSEPTKPQLRRFLSVARQAALLGGKRALKYFRKKVAVIRKLDRSPVTRADREAEQVIRGVLSRAFPGHQLRGEEYGVSGGASDYKWWIDPVDGTRQFVRGLPFWGTLIGLEYRGRVVAGVIHHPAAGLTLWAAKGLGCFANGKRAHVSRIPSLKQGLLLYGGLRLLPKAKGSKFLKLVDGCYDDRGFGDCFPHALVIQGMAEAMMDPVVKPYDVAPIKICVEEAGGRFTDLSGKSSIYGGNALTSNGLVHGKILRALR